MEKAKVKKIELEFAEARKEIMQLREENRKLESALTILSEPSISSDGKRLKSETAIVIALPEGEAKERIDALLLENAKLLDEIIEVRKISNGDSLEGSSLHAKTTELQNRIEILQEELRRESSKNIRLKNLETQISDLKSQLLIQKDDMDSKEHELEMEVSRMDRANAVLTRELEKAYEKILVNISSIPAKLDIS